MPDGVLDLDERATCWVGGERGVNGAAEQVVLKKQQVVTKNYGK